VKPSGSQVLGSPLYGFGQAPKSRLAVIPFLGCWTGAVSSPVCVRNLRLGLALSSVGFLIDSLFHPYTWPAGVFPLYKGIVLLGLALYKFRSR
jgi:hypothetical protein